MIGKKINQLATELAPVSTDLTIIGDPISGVSKKITLAQLGAIFSGAVSFYTNLASFPAVGDINVIYCAKDTQKLYLWSGSAYTEVFPSQALLDTYQLRSEKGNANGYASLDSLGKVPISQLPSSLMEYKGTWNASTNTPTLANGTGDTGDVYICNVAGTVNFGAGPLTFAVGDYVIYSGSIWQRSSGAVGTVTSVALSRSGDALAITGSPVTTSGTINVGFAGNSTQYINGAGNLVTFPGVINEAQNLITEVYNKTGATLTKGTVVYINGGQGNLPTITKALATGDSTSAQTYGIVRNDITNNNNGYVVVAGRISDLDTQAYTEGTQLYLSSTTAGAYTSTKQYAPNHLVYVGIVVRAHPTQGVVEVKIQNGYEMDELHNVAAQTPSNNDGLFWEASTSLWKNKSIATILGYTPQAQLNGTGFVKASGTTISYDNSTYVTTDTFQTISASKTFSLGFSIASAGGTNQISVFQNTNSLFSGSGGSNIFGFNSANNIYFGKGLDNGGVLQWNNSALRYYTLPDATGTLALVGGSGVGTVTSVGLSSATSGVTIGSTPITTSGTITLAIATASGSQQGLLSSTDWTTFNNKQNALTNPVTGTGTTNYLPKFTGASTIGDSAIVDNTLNVTIAKGNAANDVGLQVQQTSNFTAAYINITANNDGGAIYNAIRSNTNGGTTHWQIDGGAAVSNLVIRTGGTERLRINASGQLGIGVTSMAAELQVGKSSDVTIAMSNSSSVTSGNRGGIAWYNSSVSTVANIRAVAVTDNVGTELQFYTRPAAGSLTQILTLASTGAATFSSSVTAGGIVNSPTYFFRSINPATESGIETTIIATGNGENVRAGIFSTNNYAADVSTSLIFKTNGSSGSATERLRITSGGDLLVGTTSTTGLATGSSTNAGISLGGGVIASQVNNNSNQYWSKASGYTSGDFTAHFVNNTYVGGISTNGSTTTYAIASDYRLKTNLKEFNGLDLLNKIKTYDYEWKSDGSRMYGVIAHELQSIINYAVTGVKDGDRMQGVDYSKIVPVLIKAIQELNDKIK